jgi:hypothetical protein
MNYKRPVFFELSERLLDSKGLIQVISGPRQIGKTTLVQQLFKSKKWLGIYHVVEGMKESSSAWLESVYNSAMLKQRQSKVKVILAIDEIQKIPNWSETIKRLYDEQKFQSENHVQLILLGSSNWLMQKGLSESLAGRFEQWNLTHWTYNEMHEAFGITPEEYAYFGSYPGAQEFTNDEKRWKSYIQNSLIETVITKDVLLMERIEKPVLLRRLFELGSQYSGQILSYTKMMGQLQEAKNTTTLAHYLDLLSAAGMLSGLQKFAMDGARRRSSSPKWQVQNNALLSATSGLSLKQAMSDKKNWGRWVESCVGAHLLAHANSDFEIFYWNESNAEVDFILKWEEKYVALEVKLNHDKVTGIDKFKKQFRPHKVYQLDSRGLSWQEFITMDPRELF